MKEIKRFSTLNNCIHYLERRLKSDIVRLDLRKKTKTEVIFKIPNEAQVTFRPISKLAIIDYFG